MKKVSVVSAVYNKELFIAEMIESFLDQDYLNKELVLVNDGSSDTSGQICASFAERYPEQITFIDFKENQGAGKAFNAGVKAAKCDYIAFMGGDDLFYEGRLSSQVAELEKGGDVLLSNYTTINSDGAITGRSLDFPEDLDNNTILNHDLRRACTYSGCAMMKMGEHVFFDDSLTCALDYDMFLRLIVEGYEFKLLDIPAIYYRIHADNLSSDYGHARRMNIKVLNKYSFDQLYDALRKRDTPDKDIYITFGILSIIKFEYDIALESLEKAYSLKSSNPQTLLENEFYLANTYFFSKNYGAADKYMLEALKFTQEDPSVMNNIGVIKSRLGDDSAAEFYLQKACELMPGYMDAANNLAELEQGEEPRHYTEKLLRKSLVHIGHAKLDLES